MKMKRVLIGWLVVLTSSLSLLEAANYFYYRRQMGNDSFRIELWPEGSDPGPHAIHLLGPVSDVLRDVMGGLSPDEIKNAPVRDGKGPYSPGGDTNLDRLGNVVDLTRVRNEDIDDAAWQVLRTMARGWHDGKAGIISVITPDGNQTPAENLLAGESKKMLPAAKVGDKTRELNPFAQMIEEVTDQSWMGILRGNPRNVPGPNVVLNFSPREFQLEGVGAVKATVAGKPPVISCQIKNGAYSFAIIGLWRGTPRENRDAITFDIAGFKGPQGSAPLQGVSFDVEWGIFTNAHGDLRSEIPGYVFDRALGLPEGTGVAANVIAPVLRHFITPLSQDDLDSAIKRATSQVSQDAQVHDAALEKDLQDARQADVADKTAREAAEKEAADLRSQLATEKAAREAAEKGLEEAKKRIDELTAQLAALQTTDQEALRKAQDAFEAKLKEHQDEFEAKVKQSQTELESMKSSMSQEKQGLLEQQKALVAQKDQENAAHTATEDELALGEAIPLGFKRLPGEKFAAVVSYLASASEAHGKQATPQPAPSGCALLDDADASFLWYEQSASNPWRRHQPVDMSGNKLRFKKAPGTVAGGKDTLYAVSEDGSTIFEYVPAAPTAPKKKHQAGNKKPDKEAAVAKEAKAPASGHKQAAIRKHVGEARDLKDIEAARKTFKRIDARERSR